MNPYSIYSKYLCIFLCKSYFIDNLIDVQCDIFCISACVKLHSMLRHIRKPNQTNYMLKYASTRWIINGEWDGKWIEKWWCQKQETNIVNRNRKKSVCFTARWYKYVILFNNNSNNLVLYTRRERERRKKSMSRKAKV